MDRLARIARVLKGKVLVQGGSHRIDLGPSRQETGCFRCAALLVEDLRGMGKHASLGCIVNDLALSPDKRPKNTEMAYELPPAYLEVLEPLHHTTDVAIFWESALRNRARKGPDNALKRNHEKWVATCPAIMGAFYQRLEREGYEEVVGFYPFEDACGPINGACADVSGYALKIKVWNHFVKAGNVIVPSIIPVEI